ncbi:MAG TPA: hypothetical protein VF640_03930 [Acidimicrobiales bacterium]|jgi:hypothetical protein
MATTPTIADAAGTVIDLVTSVQERILDANRELAGRAADVVPSVPWPVDAAAPSQVAEQAFDLQAKLLEANKRFAMELLGAWAPVAGEKADADGR